MVRGLRQADIARVADRGIDAPYLSRLEAGRERPTLQTIAALEQAFAELGAPLDASEVRWLEGAVLSEWVMPSWVSDEDERARVSEIRSLLAELLMQAFRASRSRRSGLVREARDRRHRYLLK